MFLSFLPRFTKVIQINSPANNINLVSLVNPPSFPLTAICQINANVSSNSLVTPALETGNNWANGTIILIDNNSHIMGMPSDRVGAQGLPGKGGDGGRGQDSTTQGSGAGTAGQNGSTGNKGFPGGQGGPALRITPKVSKNYIILLDNTTGKIHGGRGGFGGPGGYGGGGGGSGGKQYLLFQQQAGAGGGGGAGWPAGFGGANGNIHSGYPYTIGFDGTFLYGSRGAYEPSGTGSTLRPRGNSGGNLQTAGESGQYAGGAAGTEGPAGDQGPRGYSILGLNNISKIVAIGSILGDTSNSIFQTSNVTNVYISSANTTFSSSIRFPPTANVGDVAFLFDYLKSTNEIFVNQKVVPSGWTEIKDIVSKITDLSDFNRTTISYKILTQNDISNPISGYNHGNANVASKLLITYRTNEPLSNVTISDVFSTNSTSNITNSTLILSNVTGPIAVMSQYIYTGDYFRVPGIINISPNTYATLATQNTETRFHYVKFATFTSSKPNTIFGMKTSIGLSEILQYFYVKFS